MKERPILFSGSMVRAILSGAKTQTRRVIKPQPWFMPEAYDHGPQWAWAYSWPAWEVGNGAVWGTKFSGELAEQDYFREHCPYGVPGDQLWVRETWAALHPGTDDVMREVDPRPPICSLAYRATDERSINGPWRPSIFMPRWASRITLEVVSVRVQRLQDISHEDGKAEGLDSLDGFALLWDRINEKRGYGWQVNPWVWAVEFRAVEA